MINRKRSKAPLRDQLAKNWIANLAAILACIISVVALLKSCDANRIAFEANKIAKTAELPYFKFSMICNNSNDEILIYNEGGKLRELENPIIYLFWSITSDKTLMDAQEVAVVNYYNLSSKDPLLSGAIPVKISASDPTKIDAIIGGFKKLAKQNNHLVYVSAKWYVRLQYKDIYDESHDDMYDISPIGVKKMSNNDAMRLINKYNKKVGQGEVINVSSVAPEAFYEKWKANLVSRK